MLSSKTLLFLAKLAAAVAFIVAALDAYGSLKAIHMIMSRGSSLSDALLSPPSSVLRLAGSLLLVFGTGLYLIVQRYANWIIWLGIIVYLTLTIALASASLSADMWADEAFRSALFLITVVIITAQRLNSRKSDQPTH